MLENGLNISRSIETDKHPLLYKQEEAAKEDKDALEKIAVILANLTSRKTAMVSWLISSILGVSDEFRTASSFWYLTLNLNL